jgi:hypothetical protein
MVVGCGGNPDARNPTTNFHRTLGFNHSVQIAEKEWNHPCDDDITFYLADLPRLQLGYAGRSDSWRLPGLDRPPLLRHREVPRSLHDS